MASTTAVLVNSLAWGLETPSSFLGDLAEFFADDVKVELVSPAGRDESDGYHAFVRVAADGAARDPQFLRQLAR